MAVLRADDDPVELVELGYLQNMNYFSEFGAGRAEHRSVIRERKIRDRFSFIHHGCNCTRRAWSGARTKRDHSEHDWSSMQDYADAKTGVVEAIIQRALGGVSPTQ